MRVVHPTKFFHDGRGSTLREVHLAPNSAHLEAIDFIPPDTETSPAPVFHLRFVKAQAYMFTPEEVENYAASELNWRETNMGALVCVGRSDWLKSFSQRHLDKCEHYRAMFYDEILDVICEDVLVVPGQFERQE